MKRAKNVITGQPFDDSPESPLLADAKDKIDALATAAVLTTTLPVVLWPK